MTAPVTYRTIDPFIRAYVAVVTEHAALVRIAEAAQGCADALSEAGKSFATANPMAARPNLFELHAETARAALQALASLREGSR